MERSTHTQGNQNRETTRLFLQNGTWSSCITNTRLPNILSQIVGTLELGNSCSLLMQVSMQQEGSFAIYSLARLILIQFLPCLGSSSVISQKDPRKKVSARSKIATTRLEARSSELKHAWY